VLPDGYALYDRLTGREHVDLAVELNGADDDPDAVLGRVGMADAADRPAGSYSKGMGQRLALGMALVGSPDLLVFDEPSSGLDPDGVRRLREIVREEVDRGATAFLSSHDLDQVEAVCDRVAILDGGRLVAVDTIDGLRERLGGGARLWVDADPLPDPGALSTLAGVGSAAVEDGRLVADCESGSAKFRVLAAIDDSGARLIDFETEAASLEDLFAASLDGGGTSVPADDSYGDEDDGVARTVEA
jgi:ABC-2 type transport system ATP-binding protein